MKIKKLFKLVLFILSIILLVSSCPQPDASNSNTSDTTPPTVIATNPINGATDIAVNTSLRVKFNEEMKTSTINTATFILKDEDNNPISGSVDYSGITATFIPSINLRYSTEFTATVTTNATDLAGNAIIHDYSWTFITCDTPDTTAPTVLTTSPIYGETGVAFNTTVTVTFSEEMDPTTINTNTITLKDSDNNPVEGTLSYFGNTATFTPNENLDYATMITANISMDAKDLSGNPLSDSFSWTFTVCWRISKVTSTIQGYTLGRWNSIGMDTNDKAHISYQSVNSTLGYATNASGSWKSNILSNDAVSQTSLAVDSNDKIHICYHEWINDNLKYATNISGSWAIYTIDSIGDIGAECSIAVDSNNKAHISYYDNTNGDLKYATNTSGFWSTAIIDSTAVTGRLSSIAIDKNDKVHISYQSFTYRALKYATNKSGSWILLTIAGSFYTGDTSLAIDTNNKIHISYIDGELNYATNINDSWENQMIDDLESISNSTSISLDRNNNVHISYDADMLKYATNDTGSWIISTVYRTDYLGLFNSIAIDSLDNIHISFNTDDDTLNYATNF